MNPRKIDNRFTSEAWDIFYLSLYELGILNVEEQESERTVKIKPSDDDPRNTYQRIAKAFVVKGGNNNDTSKQQIESLYQVVLNHILKFSHKLLQPEQE